MQDMINELSTEGHDVNVVIVNKTGAESSVSSLAGKCTFPVLQDVTSVGAWNLHLGGKDDIYVYDADGKLSTYFEYGGGVNISLGSSEGYNNVKDAILEVVEP